MAEAHTLVDLKCVPALGQSHLRVGQLYNIFQGQVVSEETLCSELGPLVIVEQIQQSSTKSCLSSELIKVLGIDLDSKLNALLGLVEPKGAVKSMFADQGPTDEIVTTAYVHQYRTRFESVDCQDLKTIKLNSKLQNQIHQATHMITGITYGCTTIFKASEVFEEEQSEGNFCIEDLEKDEQKANKNGFICSDIPPKAVQCIFQDAMQHMSNVVENLKESQDLAATPLIIHLNTVSSIFNDTGKPSTEIKTGLVEKVVNPLLANPVAIYLCSIQNATFHEIAPNEAMGIIDLLSHYKSVKRKCMQIQEDTMYQRFGAILQKVMIFQGLFQKKSEEMKDYLSKVVPVLRLNYSQTDLKKLMDAEENTPFCWTKSRVWFAQLEKDMKQLWDIAEKLKDVPMIKTQLELKMILSSQKRADMICLFINVPEEDEIIQAMRGALYANSCDDLVPSDQKSTFSNLDEPISMFSNLWGKYGKRDNTKFYFYVDNLKKTQCLTGNIHLYQSGDLADDNFLLFDPPGGLTVNNVTDTSFFLEWTTPEEVNSKERFKVYCEDQDGETITFTTQDRNLIINNMSPEELYSVKVCSICGPLESDLSSEIKVKMLKADACSPPGKPTWRPLSYKKVELNWEKPEQISEQILFYDIYEEEDGYLKRVSWNRFSTVVEVSPNKRYQFTVRADCGTNGMSQHSDPSTPYMKQMSKNEITKQRIKGSCRKDTVCGAGEMKIFYLLQLRETWITNRVRKCEFGKLDTSKCEKVVMFLGATGSGKTTLINGMINYIIGIEWEDDFRVRLIPEEEKASNQAHSQTSMITAYTIHHQPGFQIPYTITLVDTPGFGDTAGILKDKEITAQIGGFFKAKGGSGLDHIDAIGFVTQSALPRLTHMQKYIYHSILSLFGKDIVDNICPLLTFADGKEPRVLSSLKEAEIPFANHFKFNNSALFADKGVDSTFDELFWKMGKTSFNDFLKSVSEATPKSLGLTQEVLKERERLELQVEGISQGVAMVLNKLEQLNQEWQIFQNYESDIARNKDYEYEVNEETIETEEIEAGTYITNCLNCNRTCHYPCNIPNDENKRDCNAMHPILGFCHICPGNCDWELHKNMSYQFVTKRVTVRKTAKDLKKRYQIAEGEKKTQEKILAGIANDIDDRHVEVTKKIYQVKKCIVRLQEIALKPNPLSTVDYVETMISAEQQECTPGWTERVRQLEEVKKNAEFLDELVKGNCEPFKDHEETVKLFKTHIKTRGQGYLKDFKQYVKK